MIEYIKYLLWLPLSVEKSKNDVTWEIAIADVTPANVSDQAWVIVDVD